jgi:hypothetical protein
MLRILAPAVALAFGAALAPPAAAQSGVDLVKQASPRKAAPLR